MRRVTGFALIAAIAVVLGGCRLKGEESFLSATTPNPPGTWHGDPYGSTGLAQATGGTKPRTPYGSGSSLTASAPLNPQYDQAAKGVGQQPGEFPVRAAAGFGNSNSPANQPATSDVSSITVRTGQ